MQIPLVDFGPFLNGDIQSRKKVSDELINVVKEYGFVYLKNFGLSTEAVERHFELSKEFFNEPLDYKRSVQKSHETFCGYDGMEEEKLADDRPGDLKESYMIKRYGTPWPNDWPEFKDYIMKFHTKCYELALEILRSFAIGLNVDVSLFDTKFNNGDVTLLRLLHYPRLPDVVQDRQIRCGEHTDYGALTILFQDSTGGLEVKARNGEWIPAPHYPETVLINVGDVMEMWTNGLLTSTPHRVINPTDGAGQKSRYSTAFFCDPDLNAIIECLDQFYNGENPAKYPKKVYKDHLFGKYAATYKANFE